VSKIRRLKRPQGIDTERIPWSQNVGQYGGQYEKKRENSRDGLGRAGTSMPGE